MPISDFSFYPLYVLSRYAKQSVKAALTGDGSDELFAGYDTYRATMLNNYCGSIIRTPIVQAINKSIGEHHLYERSKLSNLSRFLSFASMNSKQAHLSWRRIFSDSELINLGIQVRQGGESGKEKVILNISDAMQLDRQTWLANNVLIKSDRASMNNGFELRAPFLSPLVFQESEKLDPKYLTNYIQGKLLLREILKKEFDISVKGKRGFISPLSYWIRDDIDYFLETIVNSQIFDENCVKSICRNHADMRRNNAHKIYTLYVYSIWSKRMKES